MREFLHFLLAGGTVSAMLFCVTNKSNGNDKEKGQTIINYWTNKAQFVTEKKAKKVQKVWSFS